MLVLPPKSEEICWSNQSTSSTTTLVPASATLLLLLLPLLLLLVPRPAISDTGCASVSDIRVAAAEDEEMEMDVEMPVGLRRMSATRASSHSRTRATRRT